MGDKQLPFAYGAFYQEQDPDDEKSVYITLFKFAVGLPVPAATTIHYSSSEKLFTSIDPQDMDADMLLRGLQNLGFSS